MTQVNNMARLRRMLKVFDITYGKRLAERASAEKLLAAIASRKAGIATGQGGSFPRQIEAAQLREAASHMLVGEALARRQAEQAGDRLLAAHARQLAIRKRLVRAKAQNAIAEDSAAIETILERTHSFKHEHK